MIDVETLVKSLPPGSAVFGRFGLMPDSRMETGFFVREDKYRIAAIPSLPNIFFKAVMFENQGIIPVVVMIKIEGIGSPYDTWWNFQTEGVGKYFDDMISQDHVLVHLYSEQKRDKSIKVINSLKEPFERFRERIIQAGPWTTDQFIYEHRKICKKYQSVQEMWDFFSKPDSKQKLYNN